MKMHENSLFAILLRSQWWASALVALALFGALRLVIPETYALFAAAPFAVIALIVAWKALRAPSRAAVAARLERLRAMPWDDFGSAMERAYARTGCQVERLGTGGADFALVQGGRRTLVACRRWKATRTGIEPLRELDEARTREEAQEAVYVSAGEVTEQARAFAAQKNIKLLEGAELVKLVG